LDETPIWILLASIVLLVFISAFFSSAETGMMALNRYRLKHLTKNKHRGAKKAKKLLDRTDRLLGVILLGNNLVNILATTLATIVTLRIWGSSGIVLMTIVFTLVILVFAEVTPKTLAARKPEAIAFTSAYVLQPLLKILYPFVVIINSISNRIIQILGVNPEENLTEDLTSDELKSILQSSGIPSRQLQMLLSIFDMEDLSVNDVMIPRNQLIGIDLKEDMESILTKLRNNDFDNLPVYKDSLDKLQGILTLEGSAQFLLKEPLKKNLVNSLQSLKFIPENTPLHTQLLNFQNDKRLVGTVVDEYGDIQGMVTRKAILEEIVGKLTSDTSASLDIMPQSDGGFMINGNTNIREVNKELEWDLPISGPKTISGLILETAQEIPQNNVGIKVEDYLFETVLIKDNVVKMALAKKLDKIINKQNEEDE